MPDFIPALPGVRLLWAGCKTIDRTWDLPLRDPYWRLYRDEAAGAAVLWRGGRLDLPAGRLALIPAWCSCRGICQHLLRQLFIHFDPGTGAPALAAPTLLPEQPGAGVLAQAVADGADGSPAWWLRAAALVHLALAAVAAPAAPSDGFDRLYPALSAIESEPQRPLGVATLARRCGLGADRFARLFRASLGVAPAAYVRRRRLAIAAERLRGGLGVAEVAEACGFANRYHFSRAFAAAMGCGPAAWRRRFR